MPALALATSLRPLPTVPRIGAVDLPTIAVPAQEKHPPAVINNALNLSEIVHPDTRPPEIRPPPANRATTSSSNASTRGDPKGSE